METQKSCNERDKLKVNASTANTLEFLPEGHSTWELSIKSTPVAFSTIGVFDLVLSGRFAMSDMSLSDVARFTLSSSFLGLLAHAICFSFSLE